jgi:predicted SAM-dependent methyltransferase
MANKIRLNLGCGQVRPQGWINTDSSLNSLIQQVPVLGKLVARRYSKVTYQSGNARYMNLNRPWAFADNSVDVVYASHLFEHLKADSARLFLREAYRTLKPGGVLRLVMPDLYKHALTYVNRYEAGEQEAYRDFLWALNLHRDNAYPPGHFLENLLGRLQGWPHQHKFMYDPYLLTKMMQENGFEAIESGAFGESKYLTEIADVENPETRGYGNSLYLEAKKPA